MFDRAGHVRPSPAGVDFVQQRAGRVSQPGTSGFFGLENVTLESGPALERVVMPAAAAEVLIAVEVAMGQDVDAGALLVARHHRERILELLAEADVLHARVERLRPHAHVEPARAGPRAGDRARQDEIFRDGEGHAHLKRNDPGNVTMKIQQRRCSLTLQRQTARMRSAARLSQRCLRTSRRTGRL